MQYKYYLEKVYLAVKPENINKFMQINEIHGSYMIKLKIIQKSMILFMDKIKLNSSESGTSFQYALYVSQPSFQVKGVQINRQNIHKSIKRYCSSQDKFIDLILQILNDKQPDVLKLSQDQQQLIQLFKSKFPSHLPKFLSNQQKQAILLKLQQKNMMKERISYCSEFDQAKVQKIKKQNLENKLNQIKDIQENTNIQKKENQNKQFMSSLLLKKKPKIQMGRKRR